MRDVDLHLTLLFGWLVKIVGKAMLAGFAAAGVLTVLGIVGEEPGFINLAFIAGPLLMAFVLATADAPLPAEGSSDQ